MLQALANVTCVLKKPSRMVSAVALQIRFRHENLRTWADRLGSSPTVDRVFRPWLPCRKPRHLMSMRARCLGFQRDAQYASLAAPTPHWAIHAESYRAKRRPSKRERKSWRGVRQQGFICLEFSLDRGGGVRVRIRIDLFPEKLRRR